MTDWMLVLLVPVAAVYAIVCVVYFVRTKRYHYDPWRHSRRKRKEGRK